MYARSVLVVEDDALVRSLIASHLEAAGFQVAVAANFTDALRLMKIIDPDGLILDIDLGPGPNGFDLAERVRRQSDEVAILFLTSLSDPRFANSKLDKSASSTTYLNKHLVTDASSLLSALEAALTDTNVEAHRDDLRTDRPLGNLSKLQIQILQLVAQGKTNQQIAVLRGRSIAATESAVSRTLKALGIDVSADINARVVAANEYMLKIKPLARRSDA
jgi:DNA-binding NarL/FixJ family response regulator